MVGQLALLKLSLDFKTLCSYFHEVVYCEIVMIFFLNICLCSIFFLV